MKILDEMNIEYNYNTSYKVKHVSFLRWDFIINMNTDNPIFIEFDGKQHFEPVRFGGISQEKSEEAFKETKIRDKIKNEFCEENGFKLLRIPYTETAIEAIVRDFIISVSV